LFLGQFLILQLEEKAVAVGRRPRAVLVAALASRIRIQLTAVQITCRALGEAELQVAKVVVDQETVWLIIDTPKEKLIICTLVRMELMDLQPQLLTHRACDTAVVAVVALVQTQKTQFNLVLVAVHLVALAVAVAVRIINLESAIQTLT
jgi:hypothetical protein